MVSYACDCSGRFVGVGLNGELLQKSNRERVTKVFGKDQASYEKAQPNSLYGV